MDLFDNCFNQHYFDLSFNVKKKFKLVLVVVIFSEVEDLVNNCLILLLG